jgi:hypothetical protein
MNHLSLFRLLLPVLLAAGLFFSACSSTSPLEQAQNEQGAKNLSEALRFANEATREQPENAEAHLLKAEIIEQYSRNFQPSDRNEMYADMAQSLTKAVDFAASDEGVTMQNRAGSVRDSAYLYERDAAENVLQNSEPLTTENRDAVVAHLENTRIIKPEDTWSYNRLFELYYEMDQTTEAIAILELMYENGLTSDRHVEALAFLYYDNEQYEESLPYFRTAWAEGSGHLNSGRGLANALITLGRQAEAEPILDRLSRVDGLRVETRLAYGRLLADKGLGKISKINTTANHPAPKDSLESALEIIEEAESELAAAYDLNRDHPSTNYVFGLFYHNLAFSIEAFYREYPFLEPDEQEDEMREQLYKSVSYLELAAEERPDATLWKSLYNAYVYLDMRENAARAGEKIGLP